MNKLWILCIVSGVISCSQVIPLVKEKTDIQADTRKTYIEKSTQRIGNPEKGRDYLIHGDFIDSGFPLVDGMNIFSDSGDSDVSAFTRIESPTGVKMIAPNCFQCHADSLNGQYILGLGNTHFDFTVDMSFATQFMKNTLISTQGSQSEIWNASSAFIRAMETTTPHIKTEVVGTNPADKLAAVLAAHRNKDDLTWREEAGLPIPDEVVPADPPAWWLLKKKNAMFTTAVGRGDFARLMMASSLLTLQDTIKAREVDSHFADVLSFINTLGAPIYPKEIDSELALQGELLFNTNCSSCHGTYGEEESYPNLLIDISLVKTDSLLAVSNYAYTEFVDWYNGSWFSQGKHAAHLEPGHGYVAPPLDGVWATAPYFHNASVPTIYHVLNSNDRPTYWTKASSSFDFDFKKVGWYFREQQSKLDKYTYDATLPGYRNEGHDFGDKLSEKERYAVVEYLKTL